KVDWAAVKTDADAQAFVELFWARRDPTPETPVNELRQQFEQRIAEADKRYGFRNTPGSVTDQGLAYVLFGEPTERVRRVMKPVRSPRGMTHFQRPINTELWIYSGGAEQRVVGSIGRLRVGSGRQGVGSDGRDCTHPAIRSCPPSYRSGGARRRCRDRPAAEITGLRRLAFCDHRRRRFLWLQRLNAPRRRAA